MFVLLLANDSFSRAGASASATFGASGSIDFVLAIAFGNSVNRAFSFASATAYAFISDRVCHSRISSFFLWNAFCDTFPAESILSYFRKKSTGFPNFLAANYTIVSKVTAKALANILRFALVDFRFFSVAWRGCAWFADCPPCRCPFPGIRSFHAAVYCGRSA